VPIGRTSDLQSGEIFIMFKWALILAVLSVVFGAFGLSGLAAGSATLAKILLVLAVLGLVLMLGLAIAGWKALRR